MKLNQIRVKNSVAESFSILNCELREKNDAIFVSNEGSRIKN